MASFLSPPEASDALLAAATREAAGDFAGALDIYRTLVARDPDDLEARYRAGTALMRKGDLEEAVTLLRQVVFSQPEHRAARANLGNAFLLMGRDEQAGETFQQVLEEDPDNRNALFGLATILNRLARYAEAAPHARRLLKAMPESAAALTLDADAQGPLGNVAGAIAQYRHALRLDAGYVPALKGLADILYRQGRLDEAREAVRRAAARAPADATILALAGTIHLAAEHWPEAIEAFAAAQESEPGNAVHSIHLSHACRKSGDLAGALSHARAAWELDGENRAAGNALGTALAAAGAGLQARSVLMAAGSRDKVTVSVWRDLDMLIPHLEQQARDQADTIASQASERAERLLASGRAQDGISADAASQAGADQETRALEGSPDSPLPQAPDGEAVQDEGDGQEGTPSMPLFPGF
jgi:tetratricopeptide (TPR) repeat protein